MKLLQRLKARFTESAWAPLLPKLLFGVLALVALGVVGSGALDRVFTSRSAHASDTDRLRPAGASVVSALGLADNHAHPADSAPSSFALPISSGSSSAPEPSASADVPRPDGKVVLNTATEAELEKLPGIGPNKAKKILELRDKLGRFKRLEDLYRIKGIKRRLIEKIRPLVLLDPEGATPAP